MRYDILGHTVVNNKGNIGTMRTSASLFLQVS